MDAGDAVRSRFRPGQRLTHARQYQAVYDRGVRRSAGAIAVVVLPNERGFWRLGLSIGKRVGIAVRRNRFKRLVREAFRLAQHDLPMREHDGGRLGFDVIVSLRSHDERPLADYRRALVELGSSAARELMRRGMA